MTLVVKAIYLLCDTIGSLRFEKKCPKEIPQTKVMQFILFSPVDAIVQILFYFIFFLGALLSFEIWKVGSSLKINENSMGALSKRSRQSEWASEWVSEPANNQKTVGS